MWPLALFSFQWVEKKTDLTNASSFWSFNLEMIQQGGTIEQILHLSKNDIALQHQSHVVVVLECHIMRNLST